MAPELYIGLLSGTSADGIDAAVLDFSEKNPRWVATHFVPYSQAIREAIFSLYESGQHEIDRLGELDILLGRAFAQAISALLKEHRIPAHHIRAIGSHGQTIRHRPRHCYPFTLQIGDPNVIAAETDITTIADFRRRDMAHGGQGAPLVPTFHQAIFAKPGINRVIVNIGGIANITLLPTHQHQPVIGFDTGPGNALLDAWTNQHLHNPYDKNGEWAHRGKIHPPLLELFLQDDFFHQPPPKSTGREYFNLKWIEKNLHRLKKSLEPQDVQATLSELTAQSIMHSITSHFSEGEILVCGGGVHNTFLMTRLKHQNPAFSVHSTSFLEIDPDWIEAAAFAWLAKQTLEGKSGNLPSVTGADQSVILGGIYLGNVTLR